MASAFSPDERLLAISSIGEIIIWDITLQKEVYRFGKPIGKDPTGALLASKLIFSNDGKRLAAITEEVSQEHVIKIFDLTTYKELNSFDGKRSALTTISPSFHYATILSDENKLIVWDLTVNKQTNAIDIASDVLEDLDNDYEPVFTNQGRNLLIYTYTNNQLLEYDLTTGKLIKKFQNKFRYDNLAHTTDTKYLLTIIDNVLYTLSYPDYKMTSKAKLNSLEGRDLALKNTHFLNDGKSLIAENNFPPSPSWFKLDFSKGKLITYIESKKIVREGLEKMALSPSGKYVFTSSYIAKSQLRDFDGNIVKDLSEPAAVITAMGFSSANYQLYIGTYDGRLQQLDIATGKVSEVMQMDGPIMHVSCSKDGKQFTVAIEDEVEEKGAFHVFDMSTKKELKKYFADIQIQGQVYSADKKLTAFKSGYGLVLMKSANAPKSYFIALSKNDKADYAIVSTDNHITGTPIGMKTLIQFLREGKIVIVDPLKYSGYLPNLLTKDLLTP
ncbi:WD40 repeat domain-containing protein [Spirosoma radiotolerans]|nr:hypothetical protein [Spirosoma radiotolerans]